MGGGGEGGREKREKKGKTERKEERMRRKKNEEVCDRRTTVKTYEVDGFFSSTLISSEGDNRTTDVRLQRESEEERKERIE